MIRRLEYDEIDFVKYQKCLENSEQRKYSVEKIFLDTTSQNNWDLLVYGDYDAVMPIPYIVKWGFKIVVNPRLTQQLGVFSLKDSKEINEQFLAFFKKNYRIWYYAFNDQNEFVTSLKRRKNFLISSGNYEEVRQRYSPKRKRKLRLNPGVIEFSEIRDHIKFQEVKTFIKKNMMGVEKQKEIEAYVFILESFYMKNLIDFYGFYFKDELINLVAIYQEKYASVLLGTYNVKELVKLNGASNLIDYAIKKNIEHKLFDFEGGDFPHLEEYFRGFRGEMKTYPVIENSKAQLLLSMFRKK